MSKNMLSTQTPWDAVAPGYAEITMKLFRTYADAALQLAKLGRDDHIVDIACGPGTLALAAAPSVANIQAVDFSKSMLEWLHKHIDQNDISNIESHCGDAQQLPFEDNRFDAAFSMFGLMFFPDRAKGYAEIYRTLKPGGKTVISSWAPVAESSAFQAIFGALKTINPDIPEPQTDIESLENPDFFSRELAKAGFTNISIHRVTGNMEIKTVEAFWSDMCKANAPLVMLINSMPAAVWQEKNRIALEYLRMRIPQTPTQVSAVAWLAYAEK